MWKIFHYLLFLSFFLSFHAQVKGNPSQITQNATILNINSLRWIDNQRIIALTDDFRVYLSKDHGMTWQDQTNAMPNCRINGNFPVFLYPHSNDDSKIYIRGNGTYCWRSSDKGDTWQSVTPGRTLINLIWHPTISIYALAQSGTDLYFTDDFANSWKLIRKGISSGQYNWGDAGVNQVPIDRVYTIETQNGVPTFIATNYYGSTSFVVMQYTIQFLFLEKQLFIATYDPTNFQVFLKVSPDIGIPIDKKKFYLAEFPFGDSLQNNAYSILDDSTGAVFMGILHNEISNLYVSDSLGYRYITSLQHISQFTSVNYVFYDFEKVQGIEGVYLTNQIQNWQDPNPIIEEKQTYFSFNNGGEWMEVNPPRFDQNGNPITCPTGQRCKLNLHGWSSLASGSIFGPFYSSASAVGLILATGNVGDYLTLDPSQTNTYLSNDAGYTWREIKSGSSIYEIGDHGGIIVFADFGKPTNQIQYTLDFGNTLNTLNLNIGYIDVYNIISEPSSTGEKFIVIGAQGSNQVLIGLDFSLVFDRVCDPLNDYELWSPSDHRETLHGKTCLLGRTVTYRRRKPTSLCFNNELVESIQSITNCACIRDDYECDLYYHLDSNNNCVLYSGRYITYPPDYCPPGTTYSKTQGYRLIANDSCVGGLNLNPEGAYPCPNPEDAQNGWIAVVVVLPLVCCCLLVAFVVARSPRVQRKFPILKALGTWKSGYLAARPQSLIDEQEDEFTVSEIQQNEREEKEEQKEQKEEPKPLEPTNNTSINNDDFNPRA